MIKRGLWAYVAVVIWFLLVTVLCAYLFAPESPIYLGHLKQIDSGVREVFFTIVALMGLLFFWLLASFFKVQQQQGFWVWAITLVLATMNLAGYFICGEPYGEPAFISVVIILMSFVLAAVSSFIFWGGGETMEHSRLAFLLYGILAGVGLLLFIFVFYMPSLFRVIFSKSLGLSVLRVLVFLIAWKFLDWVWVYCKAKKLKKRG